MGSIVKEGQLFKLPTWSQGPAIKLEKQFKLRYFCLAREDGDSRFFYYTTEKAYRSGEAPSGSIDTTVVWFERVNKLDFVLTNEKKRLWCRAFSEQIANSWEEAILSVGGRVVVEDNAE